MGFDKTTYMVNETDEQVEVCVNVSVPEDQNIGNVTFNLAVETQNGTASTSKILDKIWMEILHFRTTVSLQLSLLTSLPMVIIDMQQTPLPHTHLFAHTLNNTQWALALSALG